MNTNRRKMIFLDKIPEKKSDVKRKKQVNEREPSDDCTIYWMNVYSSMREEFHQLLAKERSENLKCKQHISALEKKSNCKNS